MRIIGLFGHGNCGKSETLNELKELLRASGKSISLAEHSFCDKPETIEYCRIKEPFLLRPHRNGGHIEINFW